ncbi:hypothetical protein [Clostridium sp.]|uniref:hypothetical protein n=1 Tax=Clostridium sp. TaxID=1506 RepID=UPI0026189BDE|nr:hypothetical protein [Clostridium sp.]
MKKKLLIINCIMLFLTIIVYKISEYILNLNNLAFLNWVNFVFICIFTILLFLILIQIIVFLHKLIWKSGTKTSTRILCRLGILFIVLIIGIYIFFGFILYVFTNKPEHILEKDGKKIIASVDSFFEVRVQYYDYINPFVRGNKIRIEEDYGDGGYDPFDLNEKIIPKRITYYNDSGDVINEIEK